LNTIYQSLPSEIKDFDLNLLDSKINHSYIKVFLTSALPVLTPTIIQQIHLAKSSNQAKNTLIFVSLTTAIFYHLIITCALVTFYLNPEINHSSSYNSLLYLVDAVVNSATLKGLAFCGILSVMFSTIDTCANTATISLVNDVLKLKFKDKDDFSLIKIATILIGTTSLCASYFVDNILELFFFGVSTWGSIVTIPLLAGIFKFKIHKTAFYASSLSGIIVNIIYYLGYSEVIQIIGNLTSALIINTIVFFIVNLACNIRYQAIS
jgi:Na+/proline symporter